MKKRPVPRPQRALPIIRMWMISAVERTKAPTADKARPVTRSLRLPKRSAIIPDGSSVKILEMNQAEETNPTRTSEGSSSLAKSGRKAADKLMPIISVKAAMRSSK